MRYTNARCSRPLAFVLAQAPRGLSPVLDEPNSSRAGITGDAMNKILLASGLMPDSGDLVATLRAENARLLALLEAHGIERSLPSEVVESLEAAESSRISIDEKVALFRQLFRGRTHVYPLRWESKTTGKSGYSPACANEWRAGIIPVLDEFDSSRTGQSPLGA